LKHYRKESSFSEEKEAKRLLFPGAAERGCKLGTQVEDARR
jgi:hypothetical protein